MLNTRLGMRLSQEVKTKAEKAAALLCLKSLTEYVVHLMDEDATKVIKQHESMVIENDCFDKFMQACDKAKSPNQALKDTAKLTKKLSIRRKVGQITLIKALEFLWEINQQMPAYAVVVDCLNEKVEKFYKKFGFEVLDNINGKVRMFIPMKTVEELF